jgi:hypothetical protein
VALVVRMRKGIKGKKIFANVSTRKSVKKKRKKGKSVGISQGYKSIKHEGKNDTSIF